jgi:AraC-like DNA-binding protein
LPDDVLQPDQVDFTAELRLDTQDGAAWRWMVEGLVNLVAMPGLAHRAHEAGLPPAQGGAGVASLNHAWRRHLEETAMLFLLSQQPNWLWSHGAGPAAQSLLPVPHEPASTHRDAIDRLEAYIAQRLCAPVSLFDLAKAAGLSVRSLHSLCRQRWNESPMTVLRHRRLDAARRRLLQGDANVTEVALDHGFGHLGRFSSYYRERFGELPSATARSV